MNKQEIINRLLEIEEAADTEQIDVASLKINHLIADLALSKWKDEGDDQSETILKFTRH